MVLWQPTILVRITNKLEMPPLHLVAAVGAVTARVVARLTAKGPARLTANHPAARAAVKSLNSDLRSLQPKVARR